MPPLDRMRLTTIGEDGLGPGVVLAQGTVFFLYAMGYLAAQISAFDFAGGFCLGGCLNDLPPRTDEFDGGSGFALFDGTTEEEFRFKFLGGGLDVDFELDGGFS